MRVSLLQRTSPQQQHPDNKISTTKPQQKNPHNKTPTTNRRRRAHEEALRVNPRKDHPNVRSRASEGGAFSPKHKLPESPEGGWGSPHSFRQ